MLPYAHEHMLIRLMAAFAAICHITFTDAATYIIIIDDATAIRHIDTSRSCHIAVSPQYYIRCFIAIQRQPTYRRYAAAATLHLRHGFPLRYR